MKYRVIATNSDMYPYRVERKNEKAFFPFWRRITEFKSHHEAWRFVRDATERHVRHPAGYIALEYDESDLVIEKLKNGESAERNIGATAAQSAFSGPYITKTPAINTLKK